MNIPRHTVYTHCCLPRRLRQHVERSMALECAQCQAETHSPMAGIAYACTNHYELRRGHVFNLLFCSPACAIAFRTALESEGYDKVVAFLPSPFPTDGDAASASAELEVLRLLDALPERPYSGSRCDNCTARHTEGTPKFKMCSACESVRYCSKECQREHWRAGHKAVCGKPLAERAPVLDVPEAWHKEVPAYMARQQAEERAHAACFSETEQWHRQAFRRGTCSWRECDKKIEGAVQLEMSLFACLRGGASHMTPLAYCSTGCRNRDSKGSVGVDFKGKS